MSTFTKSKDAHCCSCEFRFDGMYLSMTTLINEVCPAMLLDFLFSKLKEATFLKIKNVHCFGCEFCFDGIYFSMTLTNKKAGPAMPLDLVFQTENSFFCLLSKRKIRKTYVHRLSPSVRIMLMIALIRFKNR